MILRDFIEHPIGKGDASIPNKALIMSALNAKYDKITTTDKASKISLTIFRNPASDTYWFWFVLPTETERDNTYDVVYRFTDTNKAHRKELSIANYDIQVFANTPSFAYTYAYVYNQNDMLIQDLSSKLARDFYTKSPDTRNRNQNIFFDKYVYFAARYILDTKKMNRMALEAIAKPYDKKYLQSQIRSLSQIMEEYKDAEEKLKKKTRKPPKGISRSVQSTNAANPSVHLVGNQPKTKGTRSFNVSPVQKMAGRKKTIRKK